MSIMPKCVPFSVSPGPSGTLRDVSRGKWRCSPMLPPYRLPVRPDDARILSGTSLDVPVDLHTYAHIGRAMSPGDRSGQVIQSDYYRREGVSTLSSVLMLMNIKVETVLVSFLSSVLTYLSSVVSSARPGVRSTLTSNRRIQNSSSKGSERKKLKGPTGHTREKALTARTATKDQLICWL